MQSQSTRRYIPFVMLTMACLSGFNTVAHANVLTVYNMTKSDIWFEMAEESDACASHKVGHHWYFIQAFGEKGLDGMNDYGRIYASAKTVADDPANPGHPQQIPTDLTSEDNWYVPLDGTPSAGTCVVDSEPDPSLCGAYDVNTGTTEKPCAWTHHFAYDADDGECAIPPLYIFSRDCESGRCTFRMEPHCHYFPGIGGSGAPGSGGPNN